MAVLWNANVCLDTKVMDMTVKISMSAHNPQFVIRWMAGVIAQIPQGHTIVTARISTLDGIVRLISREDTVLISMFIMISRLLVLICKSIIYLYPSSTPRSEEITFALWDFCPKSHCVIFSPNFSWVNCAGVYCWCGEQKLPVGKLPRVPRSVWQQKSFRSKVLWAKLPCRVSGYAIGWGWSLSYTTSQRLLSPLYHIILKFA